MATSSKICFLQFITLFVFFVGDPVARAATIAVPAQQPTIGLAVQAAANGDTVVVSPGIYTENINFNGKAVTLISLSGPSSTTIVGANGQAALTFENQETRSTVVSGFTIEPPAGGSGFPVVLAVLGSPTLTDNVFIGGPAGTAVELNGSSSLVQRNLFEGTSCNDDGASGALEIYNNSSVSIKDNVFFNNHCPGVIIGVNPGFTADIANNTFVGNDIAVQIGGVAQHTQIIRNNVLYGNGVGFLTHYPSTVAALPSIQNNLVFGNTTNYENFVDQTGLNGNVSVDPKLGGTSVPDFHPDAGSPVIDAGINAAVDVGETDFYDGQRIRAESSVTPTVDIGAVEYVGPAPVVTLKTSATAALPGTPVTLTWTSSAATSCDGRGAWTGPLTLNGTQMLTPPAGLSTYEIVCKNALAARSQAVTLAIAAPPTLSIAASPSSVPFGVFTTITWSSTFATACTESGDWWGAAATSGSMAVYPAQDSKPSTYTLTCTGLDGTATASTVVTVVPPPTVTFISDTYNVQSGNSTQLKWTTTNATSCAAAGSWSGTVPTSGSRTIGPLTFGLDRFDLTCKGFGGTSTESLFVSVFDPAQTSSTNFGFLSDLNAYTSPGQPAPNGGLDGHGNAYAGELFPYAIYWSDNVFTQLGAATKEVIYLSGDYQVTSLSVLATGVNGDQTNQPFTITYSDGTTTTIRQSLSDWRHPQNYPGESVAFTSAYRITSTGGTQTGPYNVYGYKFAVDPSKTAISLTLPHNANVVLLGICENAEPQVNSVGYSVSTLFGITAPGTPAVDGGLDRHGNAYSSKQLPLVVDFDGQVFYNPSYGQVGVPSAATSTTIPLFGNKSGQLYVLGTGVNGNQINQTFIVTYSDGSTSIFKQGLSDWRAGQGFPGESLVLSTSSRITQSGASETGNWNLYEYTFVLNPNKSAVSLTLPDNQNVVVLAVNQSILF